MKADPKVRVAKYVLAIYRRNAKNRGRQVHLSLHHVIALIFYECFYCGAPPSNKWHVIPSVPYSGIDRVDNLAEYSATNVVPCCSICNIMKQKLDQKVFLDHCLKIVRYLKATA